jgi:hypothetical protein
MLKVYFFYYLFIILLSMHTIKEILNNQNYFSYEIVNFLENEFNNSKSELFKIDVEDKEIMEEKRRLENRFKKINFKKNIKPLFVNENNIHPKYYAWWNELEKRVEILLYEKK